MLWKVQFFLHMMHILLVRKITKKGQMKKKKKVLSHCESTSNQNHIQKHMEWHFPCIEFRKELSEHLKYVCIELQDFKNYLKFLLLLLLWVGGLEPIPAALGVGQSTPWTTDIWLQCWYLERILVSPIFTLTCMSLDGGRKSVGPERAHSMGRTCRWDAEKNTLRVNYSFTCINKNKHTAPTPSRCCVHGHLNVFLTAQHCYLELLGEFLTTFKRERNPGD